MRNFTLFALFLIPLALSAVMKTSIASGAWSNPAIWSPAGVPTPADDIVVNTAVTYSQNINFGQALFHITSSGSLIDIGTDTITFGGDLMLIEGYLSADMLAVGAVDSVVNYATVELSELSQSGLMINHTTGAICASLQLLTSDNFINDGSVSTGMWVNGAMVSGSGGQFCIAGNFINTDQISGTIDICDASPGGFGDVNSGTIAGSVTYCQAGPCTQCLLGAVAEHYQPSAVSITPHPVNTISIFEFELPQLNNGSESNFIVTDVSGRVVKQVTFSGTKFSFDRTGMDAGIYFFRVVNANDAIVTGKMMVE